MGIHSITAVVSGADRLMSIFRGHSMSLLAHQGGWDEILLVAGPMALIVLLLAIVKRRIDGHVQPASDDDGSADEGSSTDAV